MTPPTIQKYREKPVFYLPLHDGEADLGKEYPHILDIDIRGRFGLYEIGEKPVQVETENLARDPRGNLYVVNDHTFVPIPVINGKLQEERGLAKKIGNILALQEIKKESMEKLTLAK